MKNLVITQSLNTYIYSYKISQQKQLFIATKHKKTNMAAIQIPIIISFNLKLLPLT